MDARDSRHWGLLFGALLALAWALTAASGMFATLAILAGLAAAVFFALGARRMDGRARAFALTGAGLLLVAHLVFVIAFLAAQPLTFRGDPGTGVNTDPPAWADTLTTNVGQWLPTAGGVAVTIGLWGGWMLRDRVLAATGVGLLVLVLILGAAGLGSGEGGDTEGLVLRMLFGLAFLGIAAAAALPMLMPRPTDDAI